MINYEKVAEKIFAVIKGHGHTLAMFKEDGMDTTDAAEARRFFVQKPNYMVTLDDESNTIKINKNSNLSLDDLESIMKQLKNLARANMLNTHVQVFGKEITPKDFAYQAKKYRDTPMNEDYIDDEVWMVYIRANTYQGKYYESSAAPYDVSTSIAPTEQDAIDYVNDNREKVLAKLAKKRVRYGDRSIPMIGPKNRGGVEKNVFFADTYQVRGPQKVSRYVAEASLSRMSGSTKTSYQTLESVKMIVRHRKAVDEEVRGSRSRQISAIFLEQAGERFRFPHNNLQGARAMARHMYEGGEMGDAVGTYIVESVGNLIQLNEFVRYARTNKLINENSEDIIATVQENIATLRGELKGLTGANSYAKISEAIAAREASVLEEDDTDDLKDMFTVRKFDEKFGDTLPLVNRLMNEKTAWRNALVEASTQTVWLDAKEALSEVDIVEFDSPVQQMGYKIQKVANRMVETGDLKNVVGRVAGKLIEGSTLSEFEKTIVRNVMENAKVQEEKVCENCDCEPCECEKNTFESILAGYDLKMKMIEHEDFFEEDNAALRNLKQGREDRKTNVPNHSGVGAGKVREDEGDTCIRCRKGTMEVGDTMMGAQEKCNRCGYQHAVREGEMDEGMFDNIAKKAGRGLGKLVGKGARKLIDSAVAKTVAKVKKDGLGGAVAWAAKNSGDKGSLDMLANWLQFNQDHEDYALVTKMYGMAGGDHLEFEVNEADYDDYHAGEREAGAHMGMPPEDAEGMHIDRADCIDCEGSGIGVDGDMSDCYACDGTGRGDEIRSDEWSDFIGEGLGDKIADVGNKIVAKGTEVGNKLAGKAASVMGLEEDEGHSIRDILNGAELADLLSDLDKEGDIVYGASYFNKLYDHFLTTHADEIPVGSRTGRPDDVDAYVLDNLSNDYGDEVRSMIDAGLTDRKNGLGEDFPAQGHDQECAWWAGCHNDATTTEPHPILGDVPICDRCVGKLRKIEGLDEAEGDTCIRCRKGTMETGDTMTGAAEQCNRCGYQRQVSETSDMLGYDPETQWMDPAGGVHDNDEEDPRAMYEDDNDNTITKLISRSFSTSTMGDRLVKDLGMKQTFRRSGDNGVETVYSGEHQGVPFEIVTTMTRHMGDFTDLVLSRDNFPSKAAMERFYRDIKNKLTHQRYNEESISEEPGDWDHGYNYEGGGNVDPEDFMDDCQVCDGTGKHHGEDCENCDGEGYV